MHIQVTQTANGEYSVAFASIPDVKTAIREIEDEGVETPLAFIPLSDDDSAVKAFAAIAELAVNSSNGNVPLEDIMKNLFEIGVSVGRKCPQI